MKEKIILEKEKYFLKSFENRFDFLFNLINSKDKKSFDADQVLIDSATPVLKEFNRILGTSYKPKDIYGWDSLKDWAIQKGYPEEEAKDFNFKLWTDPYLLNFSKPLPGSLEIYRKFLEKSNYPIPIITVRNHNLREVTIDWFKKYLPEVSESLIIMRENDKIKGNDFKEEKLRQFKIKWHFDDSLDIKDIIINKLPDTNVVYIANSQTLNNPNLSKRLITIPNWEWSPEIYG